MKIGTAKCITLSQIQRGHVSLTGDVYDERSRVIQNAVRAQERGFPNPRAH